MTNDGWAIEVACEDLDFISDLTAAAHDPALQVSPPVRARGAVETLGFIDAQLPGFAVGVASSLVANWIWLAIAKKKPSARIQLTVRGKDRSLDLALEADSLDGAKHIIEAALEDADRSA